VRRGTATTVGSSDRGEAAVVKEGRRPDLGHTVYLALVDLTPWQQEKVLDVAVSVEHGREGWPRECWVARVNPEDEKSWRVVIAAEDVFAVGKDGERWATRAG
jgi:hypothetical protein